MEISMNKNKICVQFSLWLLPMVLGCSTLNSLFDSEGKVISSAPKIERPKLSTQLTAMPGAAPQSSGYLVQFSRYDTIKICFTSSDSLRLEKAEEQEFFLETLKLTESGRKRIGISKFSEIKVLQSYADRRGPGRFTQNTTFRVCFPHKELKIDSSDFLVIHRFEDVAFGDGEQVLYAAWKFR
jgi:hypothetical protein